MPVLIAGGHAYEPMRTRKRAATQRLQTPFLHAERRGSFAARAQNGPFRLTPPSCSPCKVTPFPLEGVTLSTSAEKGRQNSGRTAGAGSDLDPQQLFARSCAAQQFE